MAIAMHGYAEAAQSLAVVWSAAHAAAAPAAQAAQVGAGAPPSAAHPWLVPVVTTFHWPQAARPVRVVWWLPAFVRVWLPAS